MIALCASVAAEGVMPYREAWRTPLAILLQIRHAIARRHDMPCWFIADEADPGDTLAKFAGAMAAWGDIVAEIED
jgi:hypothetical protein